MFCGWSVIVALCLTIHECQGCKTVAAVSFLCFPRVDCWLHLSVLSCDDVASTVCVCSRAFKRQTLRIMFLEKLKQPKPFDHYHTLSSKPTLAIRSSPLGLHRAHWCQELLLHTGTSFPSSWTSLLTLNTTGHVAAQTGGNAVRRANRLCF